jgi:hypothetical protein
MLCAAGAAPPDTWLKESALGDTESVPAVTCSVTGIVNGLLATAAPPGPVAVSVTLPV